MLYVKIYNGGIIISEKFIKVLFKEVFSTYIPYNNGLYVYLSDQERLKGNTN